MDGRERRGVLNELAVLILQAIAFDEGAGAEANDYTDTVRENVEGTVGAGDEETWLRILEVFGGLRAGGRSKWSAMGAKGETERGAVDRSAIAREAEGGRSKKGHVAKHGHAAESKVGRVE